MSAKYDEYLRDHKECVYRAFEWLRDNTPEIFSDIACLQTVDYNCKFMHDDSKEQLDEYDAYDEYFYGNRSYQTVQDFNKAWLLHIHRNPHHWQHWVLINDNPEEGIKCIDMPEEYIIEMICDWWSFSWRSNSLYEIFAWYDDHKNHMKLSDNTRKKVEFILDTIKTKLEEVNA